MHGKVLCFESYTTTATAKFIIGDYASGTQNPHDDDFNTTRTVLSMWVKGDGTNYFNIAVLAMTNQAARILYLNATDGSDAKYAPPSTSYEFRIGSSWRAAEWQYLEVDLAARVDGLEPGETLLRIDGIVPMCHDLRLDDIKLSEGRLARSWAQVPGAALGGYLGAQTGAAGATGVSAWDKYYYHFSDLGTVMATTDADGALLGVYQPDFWGNYREVYGVRPDTMGLTGKFYDEDIDLYYFNARWYDPERGRWMSRTMLPPEWEKAYEFNISNPVNMVDYTGHAWGLGGGFVGGFVGGVVGAMVGAPVGFVHGLFTCGVRDTECMCRKIMGATAGMSAGLAVTGAIAGAGMSGDVITAGVIAVGGVGGVIASGITGYVAGDLASLLCDDKHDNHGGNSDSHAIDPNYDECQG